MPSSIVKYFLILSLLSGCQAQPVVTNISSISTSETPFSDGNNFDLNAVKNGNTCVSVIDGSLTFKFYAWPNQKLPTLLLTELKKNSLLNNTLSNVEAFYLVDFIKYGVKTDKLLGLTCHNSKTNKYPIFLSYKTFIEERPAKAMEALNTEIYDYNSEDVSHDVGDQALEIIVHEMFHVVDLVHYIDQKTSWLTPERDKLHKLSWKDKSLTKSLFGDFLKSESHETNIRYLSDDFQFIKTKTNFINDRAAENTIEDFANTLTSYYLNTRYQMWEEVIVSNSGTTTFEFSTKNLMQNSQMHRSKICAFVKLVLQEECKI